MADGLKGALGGLGEAIIKPVQQEVKEVFNETIQSITGSTSNQDPQEEAKKKADEAKQKAYWQNYLAQTETEMQKARQERLQKEQERLKAMEQEKQVKEEKKIGITQKSQNIDLSNKQRSTERKVGMG